ncbi:PREDICTED: NADH dehydrogenase [ubiquinone] 1 beta subcomplex subunit 3 isoform X2 [Vollenhovia emeryi]|nr:PREDICTED: NADH dehydrogenase [ubiquinone] 1 beta subcomplex subunit 3 isoform X2 [Vollenhovia emeryi]XP_011879638.1 PREDICTED: NADH dehydrogenase [ubiquinone] 1 beta subcomplex subunit 3 isoform X2 [Vollenhovia emeryi]
MGGHEHHKGPPYPIPSPDIYKVDDVPELKRVQEQLAKKGLRDPWLRNQVWRYTAVRKPGESSFMRGFSVIIRGWRFAVPAFLITIAVEKYFGIDYSGHGHHHEDDHH